MDLLKAALFLLWPRPSVFSKPLQRGGLEVCILRPLKLLEGFNTMENNTINAARPLSLIARDIRRAWSRVYFAAAPYLDAMSSLNSINDKYYQDDARGIVRYFLANAAQFRGDQAKALKAELKALL
jgi:hypothetical protein